MIKRPKGWETESAVRILILLPYDSMLDHMYSFIVHKTNSSHHGLGPLIMRKQFLCMFFFIARAVMTSSNGKTYSSWISFIAKIRNNPFQPIMHVLITSQIICIGVQCTKLCLPRWCKLWHVQTRPPPLVFSNQHLESLLMLEGFLPSSVTH